MSYDYISFTQPDVKSTVNGLIEASRHWRPLPYRMEPKFDFDLFRRDFEENRPAARPSTSDEETLRQVLDIVLNPKYMRGTPAHIFDDERDVTGFIKSAIAENRPLQVVIPSFPGRPHNLATHRRVRPDLGELYAFMLLKNLAVHVKSVYDPGLQIIILLDGKAYAEFYGSCLGGEFQYPVDLQSMIDSLSAREELRLVDLQDLVDARQEEFKTVQQVIRTELTAEWESEHYPFRDQLIDSMRLGTDTSAVNAAAIQMVKTDTDEVDANDVVIRMRRAVLERAAATAFEYMVFLATIKKLEIIRQAFPQSIRGTVHPKPGQYSPYLAHPDTVVQPWQGVAVRRLDGSIITVYESLIYETFTNYRAVYLEGEYEPFFFEELLMDTVTP